MFHRHDHDKCINTALQNAEDICAQKGVRLTEQRKEVFEYIWESHKPVKAYEILEKIAGETGKIQPPIVYRALDFLMENGLIHRIDSLNAFTGCLDPQSNHDTVFLICTTCGNADEYMSSDIKLAVSKAAKSNNFAAERTTIEISGQCEICKNSA